MTRTSSRKTAAQSPVTDMNTAAQTSPRLEEDIPGPSCEEEPSSSRPVRMYADGNFVVGPRAYLYISLGEILLGEFELECVEEPNSGQTFSRAFWSVRQIL